MLQVRVFVSVAREFVQSDLVVPVEVVDGGAEVDFDHRGVQARGSVRAVR